MNECEDLREIKHSLLVMVLPLGERPSIYSRQLLPISQSLEKIQSLNQMGYVYLHWHEQLWGRHEAFPYKVEGAAPLFALGAQASPRARLALGSALPWFFGPTVHQIK